MSYYLSNIVGHDRPKEYLSYLIDHRDDPSVFPSTVLVEGPEGVGKRTMVEAWTRDLNCHCGGDGSCDVCLRFENHPDDCAFDLIEPDDRGSIKIDRIRDILDDVSRRSTHRWRTIAINDVHEMTPQAADALLKTIEDGRPGIVFALMTDHLHDVIDTLVSRSIHLRCSTLSEDELDSIPCIAEYDDHEQYDAFLRYARGSASRTLAYLEGDRHDVLRHCLGLMKALFDDVPAYRLLDFMDDQVDNPASWVDPLTSIIRDLQSSYYGCEDRIIFEEYRDILESWSSDIEQDSVFDDLHDIVDSARREMRYTSISDDHIFDRMCLDLKGAIDD